MPHAPVAAGLDVLIRGRTLTGSSVYDTLTVTDKLFDGLQSLFLSSGLRPGYHAGPAVLFPGVWPPGGGPPPPGSPPARGCQRDFS